MRIRSITTVAALAAVSLTSAACGKDGTGSDNSKVGEASFSYSGARSGSFSTRGEYQPNNTGVYDFAAAYVDDADGTINLVGGDARSSTTGDVILVSAPDREATTTCTDHTTSCDILGVFAINVNASTDDVDDLFGGDVGTVTISSRTSTRVRGTFSFRMDDLRGGATGLDVRSGSFDVPVVSSDIAISRSGVDGPQLNALIARATRSR